MRHRLVIMPEDKLHEDAKEEMIRLIKDNFSKGKGTQLQELQNYFQKPPYELSEGTIINYLNELVESKRISTWKSKNLRYYGPPQIPLPVKFGAAVITITIILGVIIDNIFPFAIKYIYFTTTMLPFIVYSTLISLIFTISWYITQRKVYK